MLSNFLLTINVFFFNAICSFAQEDAILSDLKKNGIELKIDSSTVFKRENDISFFFYYNFQGVRMQLNAVISNSKFFYNQSQLIIARKYSELNKKITEIDTLKVIRSISSQTNGVQDVKFISKSAYSGKYTDQLLNAKDLPFQLYLGLFEIDPNKDSFKFFEKDSLVEVNWLTSLNLKNYEPFIVFKSKEFIGKSFARINPVDLWYQRTILIDLSDYSILSDDLKSKRHISYYHQ